MLYLLPIQPGSTVYLVDKDNEFSMSEEIATSVGIDERGKLFVTIEEVDFEVGIDDVFLTRKDAEKYIEDPYSIPDDYGVIDLSVLKLSAGNGFNPGTTYYRAYCLLNIWFVAEDVVDTLWIDQNGTVSVDGWIPGKDSVFLDRSDAVAYVKQHLKEGEFFLEKEWPYMSL